MCRFALLVAIIIAPCIFGQPGNIPDVNPEVSKTARKFINEVWPGLEELAPLHPATGADYAATLQTFEEAVIQAKDLQQTRLGKELRYRLTAKEPKIPKININTMLAMEYDGVTPKDVAFTAKEIGTLDQNPKITDQMIQEGADGFMRILNFYHVDGPIRDMIDLVTAELVSLLIMCLITPHSGKV